MRLFRLPFIPVETAVLVNVTVLVTCILLEVHSERRAVLQRNLKLLSVFFSEVLHVK